MTQTTAATKSATMGDAAKFFGIPLGTFRDEWIGNEAKKIPGLTAEDKAQILAGIGNGTFTY